MCDQPCKTIQVSTLALMRDLSNEELGELMRALVDYALSDDPYAFPSFYFPTAEAYWLLLLRDMQRHEEIEQLRRDCCLLRRDPAEYTLMRAVKEP